MSHGHLREEGVALLRGAFAIDALLRLRTAAEACFAALSRGAGDANEYDAKQYRFTPYSYSILLEALREVCGEDPRAPLHSSGIEGLTAEGMGGPVECRLAESWVRKRFAPLNAPRHYQPNSWHQDGGLGVSYDAHAAGAGPMTQLMTCWAPLQDCSGDCPGLEFVRRRLDRLLHYRDLGDASLRKQFAPELFWAPELKLGDVLIFDAGSLHRTYVRPEMRQDRLSVEYRFFPAALTR